MLDPHGATSPAPERPFIRTSVTLARLIAAFGVTVALAFASTAVVLAALTTPNPTGLLIDDIVAWAAGAAAYGAVGLVVAWRRSANAIGWLFLLIGLAGTSGVLGVAYAGYALVAGARGSSVAAWYSTLELAIGSGLILVVFGLLFPTGMLPSRRWLPVLATGTFGVALTTIGLAFAPGQLLAAPIQNPFALGNGSSLPQAIEEVGAACLFVAVCGALLSLVVRFETARPLERQQLKWMAAAVLIIAFAAVVTLVQGGGATGVGKAGGSLALDCIPVAAGIAILRYRLYDIDLLVKRTFVYGVTSATIAVTFYLGVVGLQPFLRALTQGNEIAVAASTLLSFALFQPVRRLVQEAVDRRFDRSRYDAVRTLEFFVDRLRDEVGLDALNGDLVGVVRQTMAPAHASLWLRAPSRDDMRMGGA